MKNPVKLLLFSIMLFGASFSASAQIYVKIRPVVPVVVVTPQPTHTHVWIGEEWRTDGGGYIYSGSRWDSPPHDGDRWNQGHWRRHRHEGNEWIQGSWKGRRK